MESDKGLVSLNDMSGLEPLTEREVDILRLLSEGLTNHEIAHELGLALETVKWYNKRIYGKLGVSNRTQAVSLGTTRGLLHNGKQSEVIAPALPRHNLPAQITPLVGRHSEIIEVRRLFESARLLTLIGPAGSGKTRLALHVASELLTHFKDGIYFVPLATVTEAENILWAVSERVGFQFQPKGKPLAQLLEHFHERTLLLVLDNFEHLMDGARVLIDILEASPDVKILVTSRERLNLYGEAVYVVGGLRLPDINMLEDAPRTESLELFLQRARSVHPNIELNADNIGHVVRICHLVEGMPLGIELAATWADILSPREIADEIEHSIDILEATRRHTSYSENSMRAAFARSWILLSETQQAAFRRLSVFRNGFTRKAVGEIIKVDLRTLQALVSKSLLRYDPDTSGRYTIHELLRQYAAEHLELSGEASEVHEAHAAYFAEFMAERWLQMKGPRQKTALLEVEADIENARAAWAYWIGKENIPNLKKFFHSFWVIHDIRGWYPAGIEIFEQGVNVMRAVDTDEARSGLGWLLAAQGLYMVAGGGGTRKGFELAQQGVRLLEGLKRRDEMVIPLISLFVTAIQVNEGGVAVQAAQDCLHIASEIGDGWGEAKAKQFLGMRAIEDGEYELANRLGHEALAIFEESGDTWSKSILCIELLGVLAITSRQWDEATGWIKRGLQAAEAIDFKYSIQMAYWQLGYIEALQDNYLKAGQYWRMALGVGDRVIGGKSIIGFGGSSSSGEWGGRTLINE